MNPHFFSSQPPLEMWGGVECSFVRLQHHCSDQLARTGHADRLDDLDRFAALGLRTLRYPILWERHPGTPIDWRWADERLNRLRELGIRPIVGLLHHGCGPLPDGFFDPGFVDGFTQFARAVAGRFPWVDAYTPVNEPLTTARFSGMYGLWHPLRCDLPSFARILLNQCNAIRSAMRAIREVNPAALLIQTEDVGKTHSTPLLAYQADLENERRWLSLDLLSGRLREGTPMFEYLLDSGLEREELESFVEDPCRPDMIGMNHYVTSERLLDENLDNYPRAFHGGNEHHAYADVPAVRARAEGALGPARLLQEVWQRYELPIAITEAQLACTREEQLRWLLGMWTAANEARSAGADVRAVTAWALLGAYEWDSLLVETNGYYESGAFDVHAAPLRITAVGHAVQSLASGDRYEHPAALGPGWWRRPIRLIFPPVSCATRGPDIRKASPASPATVRPILIIGATGSLRRVLEHTVEVRGLSAVFLPPETIDLSNPARWECARRRYNPWAVLMAVDSHDGGRFPRVAEAYGDRPALVEHVRALSENAKIGVGIISDEPFAVDNDGWSFVTTCGVADVNDPGQPGDLSTATSIRAGARPVRQEHRVEPCAQTHLPAQIDTALNLLVDAFGSGHVVLVPTGARENASRHDTAGLPR